MREPTMPEPTTPEPTMPEPTTPERTKTEPTIRDTTPAEPAPGDDSMSAVRVIGAADARATRSARGTVEIDAPVERVWRALTDAADLERWFPLEARVEPGEGGSIFMSWKNEYSGSSRILAWEPGRLLRTTWGHEEGAPGQVTDYILEARGGRTLLRVVTSGFPTDPSWDEWIEGTRLGWQFELFSLKHYLERHEGKDRRVVYLRRRVTLSREQAWDRLFGPEGFGGLPGVTPGTHTEASPFGGEPFGEPFLESREHPRQYAAVVRDPPGALARLSNEPAMGRSDAIDVTFWMSAWGGYGTRLREIEHEWRALLERVFREGETV